MRINIIWFRDDFRLTDNPTLQLAARNAQALLCVAVNQAPNELNQWGETALPFARRSAHSSATWQQAAEGLHQQLHTLGQGLQLLDSVQAIADLVVALRTAHPGATISVLTQAIPAPYEQAHAWALRDALDDINAASGEPAPIELLEVDSADLLNGDELPFGQAHTLHKLPSVFTAFRQQVERAGMPVREWVPPPSALPLPPVGFEPPKQLGLAAAFDAQSTQQPPLHLPLHVPEQFDDPVHISERAGLAHVRWYFADQKAHSYKATRNGLMRTPQIGAGYATKLSPWLAKGCVSAATVWQALKAFEAQHGASNSSYWIGFELLWREHFRWLHKQHGQALYRARGLDNTASKKSACSKLPIKQQRAQFERWSTGQTEHAFVNAGMRELALTGYVSNRMRQILASYWLHECGGDWRMGAAWFEHTLIDFDAMSNTGNWLYIAGFGSDPKGGRKFDVDWQAKRYDADGRYTKRWALATQ